MAKPKHKPTSTNKIFDLLRQFEPATMRQFSKFVASPFFNESKTLSALFLELEKLVKAEKTAFDKEMIWVKIFPDRPFDDVLFRRINANLMELAERFLAEKALESKPSVISLFKYEQYEKEHFPMNDNLFSQAQNQIKQTYLKQTSSEFFELFQLQKINYKTLKFNNERLISYPVHEITQQLDLYYFVEKLRFYCINKATSRINRHVDFIEPILLQVGDMFEKYPYIIQLFYLASQCLKNQENENSFLDFKSAIMNNAGLIDIDDSSMLFEFAMNCCILNTNRGRASYYHYYFELTGRALELNLLLDQNNQIAPWHFNNIVANALRIDKLNWAELFIQEKQSFLNVSVRENIVKFNLARVLWYKKDFTNLMNLLRDYEFEDIASSLIAKATLMKAYYELNEIDALGSFLDSFRVFVNRHKEIAQQRRSNYLNLLKLVRHLMNITAGEQKKIQKLREELSDPKYVLDVEWLKEKLNVLEGKKK